MSGRVGSITTEIIADGLIFNMDVANRASYPVQRTFLTSESGSCFNTLDLSQSGSLISDPTFIQSPTPNFEFDGVDDRIDTPAIDLGLENTISFWAKRNGTNLNGMVWGGVFQSNYYVVYLNNSNQVLYRVGSGANSFTNIDIRTIIGTDAWFHCALVRNNSGADVLCYINGVLRQTITGIVGSTDNTIVTNIGSRGPTPLDFEITGNISNTQLYNRALSSTEVLHNYNALKGRFGLS